MHGQQEYEKLLMRTDLDRGARELVSVTLLPRQKAHVAEVERLIAGHLEAKKRG